MYSISSTEWYVVQSILLDEDRRPKVEVSLKGSCQLGKTYVSYQTGRQGGLGLGRHMHKDRWTVSGCLICVSLYDAPPARLPTCLPDLV